MDINYINIYLAHRNDTRFFEHQVTLIRKYFQCNASSKIQIYGFVDSPTNAENMKNAWEDLGVIPIHIPGIIDHQDRNANGISVSYGLAFQYTYDNYILNDKYISIFIENDVFPFKYINIDEYISNYEMCGEVRFNAANLPVRITHFWLGFMIFNHKIMQNREQFSGLCTYIKPYDCKNMYWTDCGATSYYWINSKQHNIRQMVTNGNETYDGFKSNECTPHNITTDIEHLPEIFRDGYLPHYRVVVYDNCLIHLEQMGKVTQPGRYELPQLSKYHWWCKCYNKLIS